MAVTDARDRSLRDFGPGLRPAERVLAAYLALTAGGLVLFGQGLPGRIVLIALHLLTLALFAGLGRWGSKMPGPLALVRRFLPLPFGPIIYTEVAVLNDLFWRGHTFDAVVLRWEQALWGANVSQEWARAWPWPLGSEALHFGYFAYYFLPVALLVALARRHAWDRIEETLTILSLAFTTCQLWFIAFPVAGPYQYLGPLDPLPPGTVFVPLVHRIVAAGSSVGTAFPSSHVAIAGSVLGAAILHDRRVARAMAPIVLLLAMGTVYGGFHYLSDAIAGALWAVTCTLAGRAIHRRWRPFNAPATHAG